VHLPGIVFDIEQLDDLSLRIDDELVRLGADGALVLLEAAEDCVVNGMRFAVQQRGDAGELDCRRDRDAGQFAGGGVHAVLVDELVDTLARGDAGA